MSGFELKVGNGLIVDGNNTPDISIIFSVIFTPEPICSEGS